ncbi:hypothetical protein OH738_40000 [Streptomyces hirsutus]|nr:hypothetical protein OH738_00180 [Streptomyces hirsutus]WTD22302.1 hypothetical protein OH738_40000 [Streptomyces hirsutus]
MSPESFPTKVFHPAMAKRPATRSTLADGFFHRLEADEGFT